MRSPLTFIAEGRPAGKGDLQTYRGPDKRRYIAEHPPHVRRFQTAVEHAAGRAIDEIVTLDEAWREPIDGPCSIECEFRVPAPSSRARVAERDGLLWNTVGEHVEQLCRTVVDGVLRAGVVTNPARIADVHGVKHECSDAVLRSSWHGVRVTVRELPCNP